MGFYIKEGLQFEKLANLSTFTDKTFECLTIELQYPNKKIIISSIYRSPNPPPHCSIPEHLTQFSQLLNLHLHNLSNRNKMSIVFLDSNINLHTIQNDHTALNYLNSILSKGFIQVITKSTGIQGNSHSLNIDYLYINKQKH